MYAHCSHLTIILARVVLPENESPHIRYNVFILPVYFRRTKKVSQAKCCVSAEMFFMLQTRLNPSGNDLAMLHKLGAVDIGSSMR